MIENTALKSLAAKVIRQQIRERNPVDADIVEALISRNFAVTASGDIVATDENGVQRVGRSPDFAAMSIAELLDEVQAARPSLFADKASSLPSGAENPFAPGPGFNVSKQMVLWRCDPQRAEHMAAEAGIQIKRI